MEAASGAPPGSGRAAVAGRRSIVLAARRAVGATVRREIDRAIATRRVQAPEKHVRLQIARATKALALLDIRLSNGEMAAVGPFLKTLAALDRYQGSPHDVFKTAR